MSRQIMPCLVPEPLEPLNLEEVKFWLRIMEEHAFFIKGGLPCDQTEFIEETQAFHQEFASLRVRADRVQNDKKFTELVNDSHCLVKEFYIFKRKLLHKMLECKLGGWNFPLLLDHMSREAEYFRRLLDKGKNNKVTVNGGSKAEENTFWLRIMADHAKFISHLLDPSEGNLIATANGFSAEFDSLFLQGRDFSSMLHCYPEVAAFKRFIQDSRAATVRLRDFKRAAEEMIVECRLVGVIPALLADHVRREADHFLIMLTMMEKGSTKNTSCLTLPDMEEVLGVQDLVPKCKVFKTLCPEREVEELPVHIEAAAEDDDEEDDDVEWMIQDKISSQTILTPELPHAVDKGKSTVSEKKNPSAKQVLTEKNNDPSEPQNSDSKYKWSGKWPRQLGKKD